MTGLNRSLPDDAMVGQDVKNAASAILASRFFFCFTSRQTRRDGYPNSLKAARVRLAGGRLPSAVALVPLPREASGFPPSRACTSSRLTILFASISDETLASYSR